MDIVEFETLRVVAAFGVRGWSEIDRWGGFVDFGTNEPLLSWSIWEDGRLREIATYGTHFFRTTNTGNDFDVRVWNDERRNEHVLMARGLYCLGVEDESILSQLPPLTAHERLELRLSMPREFWLAQWKNVEE